MVLIQIYFTLNKSTKVSFYFILKKQGQVALTLLVLPNDDVYVYVYELYVGSKGGLEIRSSKRHEL